MLPLVRYITHYRQATQVSDDEDDSGDWEAGLQVMTRQTDLSLGQADET